MHYENIAEKLQKLQLQIADKKNNPVSTPIE